MAGSKRKLESHQTGNAPVALSAFAARKKIWATQARDVPTQEPMPEPLEVPNNESRQAEAPESNSVYQDNDSALAAVRPKKSSRASGARSISKPTSQSKSSNPLSPTHTEDAEATISPENVTMKKNVTPHSSFKPTKQNYQSKPDGRALLKLSAGERLVVLGSYGIKMSEGVITLYGSTLTPKDHVYWVHAPHCHALPVIRATEDSAIELHPAPHAKELRLLERLNPVFAKLWNESSTQVTVSRKSSKIETFQIIFTSDGGPKRAFLQDLVSPAEWNKKFAEITSHKGSPPVIFICGPKSSGKSTFGKILANRLLTNQVASRTKSRPCVVVLDIDPGQPEYSPSGMISLNQLFEPNLSPSFCRFPHVDSINGQVRTHAIASVSPGQDPEHYIECVLNLFANYRSKLGGKHPLVINTPGWVQGTGLDILTELIKAVKPTEVVYMSQEGPEETTDALELASRRCGFSTLPSQSSEYTSRTSLHLRTMQTMSYFHADVAVAQSPQWCPLPLTEIRPWVVRYSGARPGLVGILCYDNQFPPHLLAEAINGTVLALVQLEDKAAMERILATRRPSKTEDSTETAASKMDVDGEPGVSVDKATPGSPSIVRTPEGIPLISNPEGRTLNPQYSRALGLVLLRGIDSVRKELQLLTPLPERTIPEHADNLVLVAGKFDTPTWAYTEDLYNQQFDSTAGEDESERRDQVADEDTDADSSGDDQDDRIAMARRHLTEAPWVEQLHGNQKRSVGSRVWRVRRDLGKN